MAVAPAASQHRNERPAQAAQDADEGRRDEVFHAPDYRPGAAAALAKALIEFDVGTGTKRAAAAATAESDIADYRMTSEERFRDMMAPAKSQ